MDEETLKIAEQALASTGSPMDAIATLVEEHGLSYRDAALIVSELPTPAPKSKTATPTRLMREAAPPETIPTPGWTRAMFGDPRFGPVATPQPVGGHVVTCSDVRPSFYARLPPIDIAGRP